MTEPTERRGNYDPYEVCEYCGGKRHEHDRVSAQWERCQQQAAKLQIDYDRSEN